MVRIYFRGICELPHLSRLCWAAFLVWRRTTVPVLCACGEASCRGSAVAGGWEERGSPGAHRGLLSRRCRLAA